MKFYRITSLREHVLLIEGELSVAELTKYPDPEKPEQFKRVNVLIGKIERNEPIELKGGMQVVFPADANADVLDILRSHNKDTITAGLKGPVFTDENGHKHRLAAITKTDDFGGKAGGGAKGGERQTEAQEIGQAIVCGMVSVDSGVTVEDLLNQEKLAQGANRTVPAQEAIDQIPSIIQLLQADKAWATTFINTAKLLDGKIGLDGKTFHRGGPVAEAVKAAFNAANAAAEKKPFTNINKWNPADIWITSSDGVIDSIPSDSFESLNRWMLEQYKSGSLVGVSLKKASKSASVTVVNEDPGAARLRMLLDDLIISKSSTGLENILNSGDAYMTFKNESFDLGWYYMLAEASKNEVQYRSFNKGAAIQGEIGGTEARHGKISFGNIDAVLANLTGNHLTPMRDVKRMKRPELLKGIIQYAAPVMGRTVDDEDATYSIVDKNSRGRDIATLYAKYQAVQLIFFVWQFRQKNPREADLFIERIVQYASSTTPLSSVFVKVS